MLKVIAKEAGMDEAATKTAMATMEFLSPKDQLSKQWMGGTVQTYMKGIADLFLQSGSIKAVLPSYDGLINVAPLKRVAN